MSAAVAMPELGVVHNFSVCTGFRVIENIAYKNVRGIDYLIAHIDEKWDPTDLSEEPIVKKVALLYLDPNSNQWNRATILQKQYAAYWGGYKKSLSSDITLRFSDDKSTSAKYPVALIATDQDGKQRECLVSKPYLLPVTKNTRIKGGWKIVEIGDPYMCYDPNQAIVPVKIAKGGFIRPLVEKFAILECIGRRVRLFETRNPEANMIIRDSTSMPVFLSGIGSSVFHIFAEENGKKVLIKKYYNDKAEYRRDEIHR